MSHKSPFDLGIVFEPRICDNIYSKIFIGTKSGDLNWSAGVGLKSPDVRLKSSVKIKTNIFGGVNINGRDSISPLKIGYDLGIRTVLNNGSELEVEYNRSSFSSSAKEKAMVSICSYNNGYINGKKIDDIVKVKFGLSLVPQHSWMNPTTSLYFGVNLLC
jgi:hypothetical protein